MVAISPFSERVYASAASQTAAFTPPAAAPPIPPPTDAVRELAFSITGAFEGGRPDSLQTVDDGIISFGPHQATLRSGSLGLVLDAYLDRSASPVAQQLRAYAPLVAERSPLLAEDPEFLSLLRQSAAEPEMQQAQGEVFAVNYWTPAYQKANAAGLSSPLAYALFYDTAVQGGLGAIYARTAERFGSAARTEPEFLRAFLENRRSYLLEVAEIKRLQGKALQGEMLENSAAKRVGFFENWLATVEWLTAR